MNPIVRDMFLKQLKRAAADLDALANAIRGQDDLTQDKAAQSVLREACAASHHVWLAIGDLD